MGRFWRRRLEGLSPRVRGNLHAAASVRADLRSIPACAGEPVTDALKRALRTVYPRVCGGTKSPRAYMCVRAGLSPRVRGNHDVTDDELQATRSIPACAGEPSTASVSTKTNRVYPRVCGGTGMS